MPATTAPRSDTRSELTPDCEVLIVGAGFGGAGAGVALRKAGIDSFLIVDKWDRVGGTWWANRYPGVAVDIASPVYSFSFEQRADWSRLFAPGDELQRYCEDIFDKYGLRPKLRLNTRIVRAEWDGENHVWRAFSESGAEYTARFLINAVGGLEQPRLPEIEGIGSFGGKIMHTAQWDHDYNLHGKRVAVIGTGATALQLIPAIADAVGHMTVFQRTPIWVAPMIDWEFGPLTRFLLRRRPVRAAVRAAGSIAIDIAVASLLVFARRLPALPKAIEAALKAWMRTQVPDPELREKLTPKYQFGCKRPSMSNRYLKTFTRPDVDLVTEPIERVVGSGIVTADGVERPFDVIVSATGFKVMERGTTPPYPLLGRGGVDLNEFWHENRFQAYQGVSVPGFPNMFLMPGPYAFAPGSYLWMVESVSAHAVRAITETRRRGASTCEIRQEPHDRYFEKCLKRVDRTFLLTGSCAGSNTYYINYQGDGAALRPATHVEMYWQNRHFPLDDYRYSKRPEPSLSALSEHRAAEHEVRAPTVSAAS